MSNPYQTPQVPTSFNSPSNHWESRDRLRQIARYQQWVIIALLVNIAFNVIFMAVGGQGPGARLLAGLLSLPIIAGTAAVMFLLANRLYGTGVGVLCAILTVLPCIALITLLVVNQKATTTLQQAGVKVGLLGANPNSI
jgi:hypothetical protein